MSSNNENNVAIVDGKLQISKTVQQTEEFTLQDLTNRKEMQLRQREQLIQSLAKLDADLAETIDHIKMLAQAQ